MSRWRPLLIGPGLVFVMAALGPQDLLINSLAGASHQYSLLWTLPLLVAARYLVVEASARYVIVTGETLMSGYARAGRWVVWLVFVFILLKRHLTTLYQILLLGSGLDLVFSIPSGHSRMILALISIGIGFSVMFWGKYRAVEKISRPLALVLLVSLILVTAISRPDLGAVAHGMLIPSTPEHSGYGYALVLLALIGTQVGGVGNLKYAAFVAEKGWKNTSFLRALRSDLLLSAITMYVLIALLQIAAGATLYPDASGLKSVEDLVPMFTKAFGASGQILFGVTLWVIVFSTYIGANTGYAMLVSDIYHNVIRRPNSAPLPGTGGRQTHLPAYRWALIWFCISPLYVLVTDWQPLPLVLITAILVALVLPVTVSVLLWLTSSRALMGRYANSWATRILMGCLILTTLYVSWESAAGFLDGIPR